MDLLLKYKKLQQKADKYLGMHESECSKMFNLLETIIDEELSDASVFYQTDGYVLAFQMLNAPVDELIKAYNNKGKIKLTFEEVFDCGI